MSDFPQFRIRELELRLSEAWTRMPFRYGNACLTAVPILHVRASLESRDGKIARGYGADCLPPRWFDKDPERDFRQNVDDILAAIVSARAVYLEVGGGSAGGGDSHATVHELWRAAYPVVQERVGGLGLNKLTASFASSLMERALIDAACSAIGVPFCDALRDGLLGVSLGDALSERPLARIAVRHTVGLGDFIRDADIPVDERIDDGLPQSLEAAVGTYGLRWFKVKVNGAHERDVDRLTRIATLLDDLDVRDYHVSLDGNEQYRDLADLERLLAALESDPRAVRFVQSVFFIEQPLARDLALGADVRGDVERLSAVRPVIIDESDDDLDALPRAVELGYRGCSIKNCKGVFKAVEFRRRIHALNCEHGDARYFQTGEDLANVAVIPLQQDLTTLATLGVDNAERNGHHYFCGLAHLSEVERRAAVEAHPDLYEQRHDGAYLRIEDGILSCGSLHSPGYGHACEIDFGARCPLEEWRFERLGF